MPLREEAALIAILNSLEVNRLPHRQNVDLVQLY